MNRQKHLDNELGPVRLIYSAMIAISKTSKNPHFPILPTVKPEYTVGGVCIYDTGTDTGLPDIHQLLSKETPK